MPQDGPELPPDYSYRNDLPLPQIPEIPQISLELKVPNSVDLWEYKYVPLPSIETLNALGIKGWQVVLYLQSNNSFLLIRQVIVETEEEEAERLKREREMAMTDEEVEEERRKHREGQEEAVRQERLRYARGNVLGSDSPDEEPGE